MTGENKSRMFERIRRWSRVVLLLLLAWPLAAWIGAKGLIVKAESRRALWTLRRVFNGSNLVIGVMPAEPEQSPNAATWWLHRFGWKSVPLEYVKIIYYRWKY